MLALDVRGAALAPGSEAGGASFPLEVLGEAGCYSGLTLAGDWSSPLSGPDISPLSASPEYISNQPRKRAPEE